MREVEGIVVSSGWTRLVELKHALYLLHAHSSVDSYSRLNRGPTRSMIDNPAILSLWAKGAPAKNFLPLRSFIDVPI